LSAPGFFGDEPVFVFHRLVGAADDAFARAVYSWFPVLEDYESGFGSFDEYRSNALDEQWLSALCLVTGFWNRKGSRFADRYPNLSRSGRVWLWTIGRPPFDFAAEFYAKLLVSCRRNPSSWHPTFWQFLDNMPNPLASAMEVTADSFGRDIDRYAFVGDARTYADTLASLRLRLISELETLPETANLQRLRITLERPLPAESASTIDPEAAEIVAGLSDDDREHFEARNPLDLRLWKAVSERYFESDANT